MTTRVRVTLSCPNRVRNRSWVSGRTGTTPWSGTAMLVASAGPMTIISCRLSRFPFEHHHRLLAPRILHDRQHRDLLGGGRRRRLGSLASHGGVSERDDDQDEHPEPTVASHACPSLPLRMPPV